MHLKSITKDVRPALAQDDGNIAKEVAGFKLNNSSPPFSGPLPK
jgi:hypothetical protein